MAIGSWDPDSKTTHVDVSIDTELLARILAIAETIVETVPEKLAETTADTGKLIDLAAAMTAEDQQQSAIMQADSDTWEAALGACNVDQLVALIRFFTLVEMQLPQWLAGPKSPVIIINKLLKQRGEKLGKETLQWIRKNSDNRFIPNGAVL